MNPEIIDDSSDDDDDYYINLGARYKSVRAKISAEKYAADVPTTDSHIKEKTSPAKVKISPIREKEEVIKSNHDNNIFSTNNIIEIVDDNPYSPNQVIIPPIWTIGPQTRSKTRRSRGQVANDITPIAVVDLSLEAVDTTFDDDDFVLINDEDDKDINYEIDVKVRWISRQVERIHLGKNENFTKIFQYFALTANVSENEILITRDGTPISPHDTPSSINLTIIDVLEGGIVTGNTHIESIEDDTPKCKIKVQMSLKKFWTFELKNDETFEKVFEHCAQENNVKQSQVKCYFDGELVNPSDTPNDLDLDDEACFDLKITT